MPSLAELTSDLSKKGRIEDADVLALRKLIYGGDAVVSRDEAEALIKLDQGVEQSTAAWPELFIEALSDYVVHQTPPEGYVDSEHAQWLIAAVSRDGQIRTSTELELLVEVLEKAIDAPPMLAAFALSAVKHAVLNGREDLQLDAQGHIGVISEGDVALLRRILYAASGSGNVAVTRDEAEVLFDLNDATRSAQNAPAWSDLFVKAIAGAVMSVSGYRPPSGEVALARAAWLDEQSEGIGSFMGKMAHSLGGLFSPREVEVDRSALREAEYRAAEPVTAEEAEWLVARLSRDGTLDANERMLLRFIEAESPSIHPSLKALVARLS